MKKLLVILILLGACVFGALNYHFVLLDDSLKVLKKVDMTFENTFVDARGAKKYKLYLNPDLVKAGIKDLLKKESVTIGK